MAEIDYLLIGHITADIVQDGRLLGGTVSYSAPVAHAFGHRIGILTSAAVCEPLIEPLTHIADVSLCPAQTTTTFENIYQASGRIQYVHGRASPLTYNMIPMGWLDCPLLHLAPLVAEVDTRIASRFPNATVLLTPQGYLRRWDEDGRVHFKRWLDQDVLAHVDIVVFSKHDIAAAPELEAEFVQAVEHVIVTNGERGGIYYQRGEARPYAAYPVHEIDPTGAGDVFAAALLSSLLLLEYNMAAALDVAARLAAISVTRRGAWQDFSAEEIQQAFQDAQAKS